MIRRRRWHLLLLLAPAVATITLFFLVPLLLVVVYSFYTRVAGGSMVAVPTVANYVRFFTVALYPWVLVKTLRIAVLVTAFTLLLGYPLAFWLVRVRLSRKGLLLLLVLFPWLTSVIIRTYAWMIILGNQGLLNKLLGVFGAGPVRLLWQESGVIVGLVYVMLPLMVIPLYNSISQVDRRTEDAARTLGATEWSVFWRITWPLARPGLVSGCLLVFIVTLGSYVTPALLGGPRETVMPMLIEQQVTVLHYPFAAALGVILLAIVLLVASVFNRYLAARLTATVA
jgi:ABC-type spermidine/putrescine transport system permease subunit I